MSSKRLWPRILIIGYDYVPGTGTGVTMQCLFKGWPLENIAIASGAKELGKHKFAGHYYRLGSEEDKWIWPFSLMPRDKWKVSGSFSAAATPYRMQSSSDNDSSSLGLSSKPFSDASITRLTLYRFLDFLGVRDFARRLHLSKSFLSWLNNYNPDIIYSLLGSRSLIRFASDLAQVVDIPIVLHFMDDWPSIFLKKGLLSAFARRSALSELHTLVGRASLTLAISDEMSIEFAKRYNRDFHTFHNALELEDWITSAKSSWETSSPIEVLYTGRIGVANQSSITDIAFAVNSLRENGVSICFTILTPCTSHPVAEYLRKCSCVSIKPAIPHSNIPSRLALADILVLPLDFGAVEEKFARYSMPTKAVEYMASGTPTLIYAPSKHAVSKYAEAEGWGIVVGERNTEHLTKALLTISHNLKLRTSLGQKAIMLSNTYHNAATVRENFQNILLDTARTRLTRV